jgi:hypothetical protein
MAISAGSLPPITEMPTGPLRGLGAAVIGRLISA